MVSPLYEVVCSVLVVFEGAVPLTRFGAGVRFGCSIGGVDDLFFGGARGLGGSMPCATKALRIEGGNLRSRRPFSSRYSTPIGDL
jgi:hypothetical protein